MKKFFMALAALLFVLGSLQAQTNVKVNKTTKAYEPEEPSIYINPSDPLNIIIGANIDFYYYTFDGGKTWSEGNLPGPIVWGDPCLYFDNYGTAYYLHLGIYENSGIYITKSTDGGKSWRNSRKIFGKAEAPFQDKEWITMDKTNSPYKDNMYIGWTEFDKYESENPRDSSRIRFIKSTDFGETFSNSIVISDRGGDCHDGDSTVEGAVPTVGPEGEVYIAWSGPRGIEFDKSLDGGETFGKDIFVTEQVKGWAYDVPGIYRSSGLPFTACDISESQYKGNIYINFSDERYGDHDVFVIKSTDKGETWGDAVRVNDDSVGNGKEQFMSHFCVDPVTGVIYVLFYDRRNYGGYETDVYVAISEDGGNTFVNKKISDSPFIPNAKTFFGDYIGINSYNNIYSAVWMRLDRTVLNLMNYTNRDK